MAAARELTRKLVGDTLALQALDQLGRLSTTELRNNLQGVETLYALSFANMTRRHRPVLHARIVARLIALDSALHAPSIEHVEGSVVLTLTEKLSVDFEEVAPILEMEGINPD